MYYYLSKREERILFTSCINKEILVSTASHKMLFSPYTK
ncbi:hypothetical protein EMIT0180MI3_12438 [Priestia megaterium]